MQTLGIAWNRSVATFIFFAALVSNGFSHTLPISSMMVVPDADYLHVELSVNPFELNFLPANSWEQNGRLDEKSLQQQNRLIADKISGVLKISVGGKLVRAETVGVWSDADSHHLTFLAHYRADAVHQALTIESALTDLTSSSHVTEITYQRGGQQQLARFDSQANRVKFESFEKSAAATASAISASAPVNSSWVFPGKFLVLAVVTLVLLVGFVWKLRTPLQPPA